MKLYDCFNLMQYTSIGGVLIAIAAGMIAEVRSAKAARASLRPKPIKHRVTLCDEDGIAFREFHLTGKQMAKLVSEFEHAS